MAQIELETNLLKPKEYNQGETQEKRTPTKIKQPNQHGKQG